MKDKKLWILIFLTIFWLFFFFKDKNKVQTIPPQRRNSRQRINDSSIESSVDLEKFQRRRTVTLDKERDLFIPPRPKVATIKKTIITEKTFIKDELNKVMVLGLVSSGSRNKIYIEYQNDILETFEGESFSINTRDDIYDVFIGIDGDVISLKEGIHSVKREINI